MKKLNKIKNITIGDIDYRIVWDEKQSGGSFSARDKKIIIGTNLGTTRTFGVLLHELKEMIQMEQGTRFLGNTTDDFVFFYGHAQHSDLCSRLTEYLTKFL